MHRSMKDAERRCMHPGTSEALVATNTELTAHTRARRSGLLVMAALCLAAALSIRSLPASSATYGELRPLLAQHCLACHSGVSAPLGLRLDSYDGILKGSRNGAVVKSGNAADNFKAESIRRR